jgi:hypothetical protein
MATSHLTGIIAGIILDTIREKKGRLTEISDQSVINRQEFDVEGLAKMKFDRFVRLSETMARTLPKKRYEQMKSEISREFWDNIEGKEEHENGKN